MAPVGVLAVLFWLLVVREPEAPVPAPTPVNWAVIGTGDDGRSLIVSSQLSQCDDEPRYRVVGATADKIALAASAVQPPCRSLVSFSPLPRRVDVGVPLRGQRITGPGKSAATVPPSTDNIARMPRLIGLGLSEARQVVAAFRLPAPRTTGARAGVVAEQTPTAGTPIADQPRPPVLTLEPR